MWTQKKEPATETLKELGFYTLAAVPGFCWLIWNWIKLGNPVYPFAYGLFSGIGWDEVRDRAMYLYFQMFGMGKDLIVISPGVNPRSDVIKWAKKYGIIFFYLGDFHS